MHHRRWHARRRQLRTRLQAKAQQQQRDPYDLLGVERGASKAEVRAAYLQRMKLLHPDVNPSDDATQQATLLNAAYESLLRDLVRTDRHPVIAPFAI
jgi:preprotein translocase subunit Sec63